MLKQKLYKYIVQPLALVYWRVFRPVTSGARALVLFESEVLLVKNLNLPYWTMPGGGVDRGEGPEQCVARELKEELDLDEIKIEYELGTYHTKNEGKKDDIHIYIIKRDSKCFVRQWEIADAQWFSLDGLPENISKATLRRIGEYQEGKRGIEGVW